MLSKEIWMKSLKYLDEILNGIKSQLLVMFHKIETLGSFVLTWTSIQSVLLAELLKAL
jgi:hypothetical protein